LEQWDDHGKGIDWFAEHFPDAYMVLLDWGEYEKI
jgi:hypothetical protein